MSRRCQITGRGPTVGNRVSHAHNVSKRRQHINLQRVRVLVDGRVQHLRVSTKAIKSGLITRPPVKFRQRRRKAIDPKLLEVVIPIEGAEEEVTAGFFSDESVVSRMFKPKKKAESEEEEVAESPEPEVKPEKEAALPMPPDILSAETIAEFKDSSNLEPPDSPGISEGEPSKSEE